MNSLCHHCLHCKIIQNKRGSTFYLCQKSTTDPRYRKYPGQPVLICEGHAPRDEK